MGDVVLPFHAADTVVSIGEEKAEEAGALATFAPPLLATKEKAAEPGAGVGLSPPLPPSLPSSTRSSTPRAETGVGEVGGGVVEPTPSVVLRRGKWEARIVLPGRVLYVGKFRTSWDAEEAVAAALAKHTGEVRASPRDGRPPVPASSLRRTTSSAGGRRGASSRPFVDPSRPSRPTTARSDVERTSPPWLVAPSPWATASAVAPCVIVRLIPGGGARAPVFHVYDRSSRHLLLVVRAMGALRCAVYEPALRPGKPTRKWRAREPSQLEATDFAAQRKVALVSRDAQGAQLFVLRRLMRGARAATPGSTPGREDTPDGGEKWCPLVRVGYGLGSQPRSPFGTPPRGGGAGGVALLSVAVPPVSHTGVPRPLATESCVDLVEEGDDSSRGLAAAGLRLRSVLSASALASPVVADAVLAGVDGVVVVPPLVSPLHTPARSSSPPMGVPPPVVLFDMQLYVSRRLSAARQARPRPPTPPPPRASKGDTGGGAALAAAAMGASSGGVEEAKADPDPPKGVRFDLRDAALPPDEQYKDYLVKYQAPLCPLQAAAIACCHLLKVMDGDPE